MQSSHVFAGTKKQLPAPLQGGGHLDDDDEDENNGNRSHGDLKTALSKKAESLSAVVGTKPPPPGGFHQTTSVGQDPSGGSLTPSHAPLGLSRG